MHHADPNADLEQHGAHEQAANRFQSAALAAGEGGCAYRDQDKAQRPPRRFDASREWRSAQDSRARRPYSRCRVPATVRRRCGSPCAATKIAGRWVDPDRPPRHSCCWSTHRVRSAARARRIPTARTCATPIRASTARRRSGSSDSHQRTPRVQSPPSRCAVTIKGFSSKVTVNAPSAPCRHTRTNSKATAFSGWPRVSAIPQRPRQKAHDDRPERGREITMNHFVNGFAEIVVRLRIQMPVASRPIRTAQTCIGQTHPGAQHHDCGGERGPGQRDPTKPKQASLAVQG